MPFREQTERARLGIPGGLLGLARKVFDMIDSAMFCVLRSFVFFPKFIDLKTIEVDFALAFQVRLGGIATKEFASTATYLQAIDFEWPTFEVICLDWTAIVQHSSRLNVCVCVFSNRIRFNHYTINFHERSAH